MLARESPQVESEFDPATHVRLPQTPENTCTAVPKSVAPEHVDTSNICPLPTAVYQTPGARLGSPGRPPDPQKKFASVVPFTVEPVRVAPFKGRLIELVQRSLDGGSKSCKEIPKFPLEFVLRLNTKMLYN